MRSSTEQLLLKQEIFFESILTELETQYRKCSHWAWYVWPTEKKGFSEPTPRTSISIDDAEEFLRRCDIETWTNILCHLNRLIKEKGQPQKVIPKIDFGRIWHFFEFFLDKIPQYTQQHPQFYNAIVAQCELFSDY